MQTTTIKAALPQQLAERLRERAEREHRTVSNLVWHLLEQALDGRPAAPQPPSGGKPGRDTFLDGTILADR